MIYYYLKTTDENALWIALSNAGLAVQEEDQWRCTALALDIIGTIYSPTGNTLTDDEGFEYPEMTAIEGFHANLITTEEVDNLPTIEKPTTPYRKWAGQE